MEIAALSPSTHTRLQLRRTAKTRQTCPVTWNQFLENRTFVDQQAKHFCTVELNVFYLAIEDCHFVKSFAFPQIAFKQVESVHV
jgi:hypothetical protein